MANNNDERVSVNITVRSDSISESDLLELKKAIKEIAAKYGAQVQVNEAAERTFNRP